ncbi:MAG: bifunctional 5,10-methylene-tetrahydrofolate dehydrogenase/5,10-methylene-tetrahydrofolate cyclohydrolase, partial [Gammaproteobacteria bacterium]|nr:bifunctional 5,10-methylene-tetrahydrofolate dehydrogenase/5,10-methylene-tetrahydrofolate cyclohydrolase [Gammaproteobacteria bacterium]
MQLLDGTSCSGQIRQEIAEQVTQIKKQGGRAPHLAAVLVGNDGASENYVNFKVKDCAEVGFESTVIRLEASVSEAELLDKVAELNNNG